MCQFVMFLAIMCCATLGVCAVEHEEKAEAFVMSSAVQVDNSHKKPGLFICRTTWDITHVRSEKTELLWENLVRLEQEQAFGRPFQSNVLDRALLVLLEDVESELVLPEDVESDRKYTNFAQGKGPLSERRRFWYIANATDYLGTPFVPDAVRLSLTRIPGAPERVLPPVIEGFPALSYCDWKPHWWSKTTDIDAG